MNNHISQSLGKLVLILLAASMLLLLGACGNGDATEASNTDTQTDTEDATLPPAEDEDTVSQAPDANELYDFTATDGETIYRIFCSKCHGLEGIGDGPSSGSLHLTGNIALTAVGERTDEELMATITLGKGVDMPAWGLILSTEQREAVLAYVRTFSAE